MDGLATLARGIFNSSQTFEEPGPARFEACEVGAYRAAKTNTTEVSHQDCFINASQLVSWHSDSTVKQAADGNYETDSATIRVFVVHRNTDVSLNISQSSFLEILERMGADPHSLYFVSCDYDGCHYWNEEGYRPTWFVGTSINALLWTFDQKTRHTAGIFIHRRHQTFQHFGTVLRAFAKHAHLPQLLLFVIAVQQLYWYDQQTSTSELGLIRTIEKQTGFGPHPEGRLMLGWARAILGHDIHQLTTWSQHIAELSGNLSNKMRHQRVAERMLTTIANSSKGEELAELIPSEPSMRNRYESGLKELSEALPALERHMAVYADYIHYLKARADRLSTVLFALLTHEDADASVQLATATRRDGASMKTIAIMTMAFLPATFFAAFFSMPSRNADAHWIYWVCAMPATAMVFVLWLGLSERRLFRVLQTRVDRLKEVLLPRRNSERDLRSTGEGVAPSEDGREGRRRSRVETAFDAVK